MTERTFDRLAKLRAERACGYVPSTTRGDERLYDEHRGSYTRSTGRAPDHRPDRGTRVR